MTEALPFVDLLLLVFLLPVLDKIDKNVYISTLNISSLTCHQTALRQGLGSNRTAGIWVHGVIALSKLLTWTKRIQIDQQIIIDDPVLSQSKLNESIQFGFGSD